MGKIGKSLTEKQKVQVIDRLVKKWKPHLFLQEWGFDVRIVGEDRPPDQGSSMVACAEIAVNYPYKKAHITTFPAFWSSSPAKQEQMIIHELCHCHTQELWDFLQNFSNGRYHNPDEIWRSVETLTQRISLIAAVKK